MTDRKNIKLNADVFDELKADKGPHMSWPDYFKQKCLGDGYDEDTPEIDTDALSELLEAAHSIEDRTTTIERQLDDLKGV